MKALDTRSPNIFSRSFFHFFELEISFFFFFFSFSELDIFQDGDHMRRKFISGGCIEMILPESK